jgi:hypothetical protein
MLSGCGRSQPPIGAPAAAPQTSASAKHADRGTWMLPGTSSGDLIYANAPGDWVYIIDYSTGSLVTRFNPPATPVGMCADSAGDVYMAAGALPGEILKYMHGETKPIESIEEPGYEPYRCAVDPTTGNLAVFIQDTGDKPIIAIYPDGSGSPSYYTVSTSMAMPISCTYDYSGNLFADFSVFTGSDSLAELPAGSQGFDALNLNKTTETGGLFWNSTYLAMGYPGGVYHVAVSGSNATIVGNTKVKNGNGRNLWIQNGDTLLEPYGNESKQIGFWPYPKGGKPLRTVMQIDKHFRHLSSVVVSVPPSR